MLPAISPQFSYLFAARSAPSSKKLSDTPVLPGKLSSALSMARQPNTHSHKRSIKLQGTTHTHIPDSQYHLAAWSLSSSARLVRIASPSCGSTCGAPSTAARMAQEHVSNAQSRAKRDLWHDSSHVSFRARVHYTTKSKSLAQQGNHQDPTHLLQGLSRGCSGLLATALLAITRPVPPARALPRQLSPSAHQATGKCMVTTHRMPRQVLQTAAPAYTRRFFLIS